MLTNTELSHNLPNDSYYDSYCGQCEAMQIECGIHTNTTVKSNGISNESGSIHA